MADLPVEHLAPTVAELAPIEVPPQLIEACQNDPELLTMLARGQLALVQHRMVHKILNNPDVSVGQFVAVHERLAKIAKVEGPDKSAQGAGPGFSVVINLGDAGPATKTIDVTPTKVSE